MSGELASDKRVAHHPSEGPLVRKEGVGQVRIRASHGTSVQRRCWGGSRTVRDGLGTPREGYTGVVSCNFRPRYSVILVTLGGNLPIRA